MKNVPSTNHDDRALRILRLLAAVTAMVLVLAAAPGASASGLLIPSHEPANSIRIGDHLVSVEINGQVAITNVTETFENMTDRQLEGTYLFPIPEGADLTGFRMVVDGKMVDGELLPADKARETYESIVRRLRDPGIIEYVGRGLLKARIFPIAPKSTTKIQLSFQQITTPLSDMWRYVFPLRIAGENSKAYGTVRFDVKITTTSPLRGIYSPTHDVEIIRKDDHHAHVAYEKSSIDLDRDFVLLYDAQDRDVGLSVNAYKPDKGEPGYFMMLLSPTTMWKDEKPNPQDYVFVIDTSGSMASDGKIRQVQDALKYCINRLNDDDRFSIVRFSTGFDVFFDPIADVSTETKNTAIERINTFKATGGTNIEDALKAALKLRPADKEAQGRPFVIVFLTDGMGDQDRDAIEAMLKEQTAAPGVRDTIRIFPFGVGYDVNAKLLDSLALHYHGAPTYVQPGENLEQLVGDFFTVFSRPVLTDIHLTMPQGAAFTDEFPPTPGDLYAGRQLFIVGRYDQDVTGPVKLTATRNGQPVAYAWNDVKWQSNDQAGYVAPIWAGRKIAYLLDRIRLDGETSEMVKEVVSLSTKYGIQTPYTSYLVAPEYQHFVAQGPAGRPAAPPPPGIREILAPTDAASGAGGGASYPASAAPDDEVLNVVGGQIGRNISGGGGDAGSLHYYIPAAREKELRQTGQELATSSAGMDKDSGDNAIALAKSVAQLRRSTVVDRDAAIEQMQRIRIIAHRTFYNCRGVLIDSTFKADAPIISIKFAGDAYFDLLTLRPDLRPILAAGKTIVVMANDKTAIVISDAKDAIEKLTDEQKALIVKSPHQ